MTTEYCWLHLLTYCYLSLDTLRVRGSAARFVVIEISDVVLLIMGEKKKYLGVCLH